MSSILPRNLQTLHKARPCLSILVLDLIRSQSYQLSISCRSLSHSVTQSSFVLLLSSLLTFLLHQYYFYFCSVTITMSSIQEISDLSRGYCPAFAPFFGFAGIAGAMIFSCKYECAFMSSNIIRIPRRQRMLAFC